jgi:hypothetical protein
MSGHSDAPFPLPPGSRAPSTHWIGDWVGLTADLDAVAMSEIPAIAPTGNWAPIVQPVA